MTAIDEFCTNIIYAMGKLARGYVSIACYNLAGSLPIRQRVSTGVSSRLVNGKSECAMSGQVNTCTANTENVLM